MRLLPIKSLKPGESLGYPIRSQDGRILLPADSTLTEKYIERLKSFKINCVYIDDEDFEGIEVCPAITDNTKAEALAAVIDFHNAFLKGGTLRDTDIKNSAKAICSDVFKNIRSPLNLFNIYSIDDKRFLHAINTATITAGIAYYAKVPPAKIVEYVVAALLHDVAIDDIDSDDVTHVEQIYTALKEARLFSNFVTASIAMHHENYDGTGAPKKFSGEKIFEGARILAVADRFDNLVYGIGCEPYPAHLAVEYLNLMADKELDPELLSIFSKTIAIYPTAATVMLNNGYRAIVVKQNEQFPTRPVVRLLMPEKENCLLINLVKNNTVFIDSVEL